MESYASRLIVVSNRLPFVLTLSESGEWELQRGSGGLVTAMNPVLQSLGGVWVGWPGALEEERAANPRDFQRCLTDISRESDYRVEPVMLTSEEKDHFYYGFSNEILWPLFHDLLSHCNFESKYWSAYRAVNRKFALATARVSGPDDFVWVHDYHLIAVASELRSLGVSSRVGFFLHIPFPPDDIFAALPWREEVLEHLLEYDLIGFQTERDREHFVQCLRTLLEGVEIEEDGPTQLVKWAGREIVLGAFPIGIDFEEFASAAAAEEVTRQAKAFRESLDGQRILLGVDRLDYTKGIPQRLEAFRLALRRYPELQGTTTLVQVAVPSREEIPRYHELRAEIEQLVGAINGEFTLPPWVPIQYIFRSLDRTELLAYYRAADMALVTPLKDGMNLVAKEYCACNIEEDGVLVLSEFAGAASQLGNEAFVVNPHDVDAVADAIYQGVLLDRDQRRQRMRRMRNIIRHYDIHHWVEQFLSAVPPLPSCRNRDIEKARTADG